MSEPLSGGYIKDRLSAHIKELSIDVRYFAVGMIEIRLTDGYTNVSMTMSESNWRQAEDADAIGRIAYKMIMRYAELKFWKE
jgi:hypothetical protein